MHFPAIFDNLTENCWPIFTGKKWKKKSEKVVLGRSAKIDFRSSRQKLTFNFRLRPTLITMSVKLTLFLEMFDKLVSRKIFEMGVKLQNCYATLATMWTLQNFTATILSQNFRESNFLLMSFTLNWFDEICMAVNFSFFHTVLWEDYIHSFLEKKMKTNRGAFRSYCKLILRHIIFQSIIMIFFLPCFWRKERFTEF